MKERVTKGIKIVAIVVCLLGLVYFVLLSFEKKALRDRSMEYLRQVNEVSYPQEIYKTMQQNMTEEQRKQWIEKIETVLKHFMEADSEVYQRTREDIEDLVEEEMKRKPQERVKHIEEKISEKRECKVTEDTALIDLVVKREVERYDGSKGEGEIIYTFYYIKSEGQWMISDIGVDFPEI